MALNLSRRSSSSREHGQALVEFALSLPILLFFIAGLIDFSIILFSYTQESSALRDALRYAQLIGYSSDTAPYLNCTELERRASDTYFADSHDVTIRYLKADGSGNTYTCATVSNNVLRNGDILEMEVEAIVDPLFLPIGDITLNFSGQRSIIRAIPVTYTNPNISDDAPSAPYPFDVEADCDATDGAPNVSLFWDHMDPNTTTLRIFNPEDHSLVDTINITGPGMNECINCTNAKIEPHNGYKCYYAMPYNGSNGGPPTNIDCAYCITTPDPPENFNLKRNCGKGDVSFSWTWPTDGIGDPIIPSRAEIHDATTDELVTNYTGDMFITECPQCDTLELPGERSYYIVSINRAGPAERTSAPSTIQIAECPPDVGVVHGYLLEAVDSLCIDYLGGYSSQTVMLVNDDPLIPAMFATTDGDGYFYMENVPLGTWTLVPPADISGSFFITRKKGETCEPVSTNPSFEILGGEIIEYTFGYP